MTDPKALRASIDALRLRIDIAKAGQWDDGKHPRYPKGDPQGGEFAPKGFGDWISGFFHKHDVADPNWAKHGGPQIPYHTVERSGSIKHPFPDDEGRDAYIHRPTEGSSPNSPAWKDGSAVLTVVPGQKTPAYLNGIKLEAVPAAANWQTVGGQNPQIEEGLPDLDKIPGMHPAAGVIIQEQDGRVWLTKPLNGFGGYRQTFPKGTQEHGLTLQQTAIKEAWEETGLKVELVGVLGDFKRTTSVARYYIARRVGGSPAAQGWESQAMRLVPPDKMASFLNMPVDRDIWRAYSHETSITKEREPLLHAAALASLQARIDALAVTAGIEKSFDEGKHPRWPKGSPLGGQFMAQDADGITLPPKVGSPSNPQYQKKADAAYAAAKAHDITALQQMKAGVQKAVDKYGYDAEAHAAGNPAAAYVKGKHSQAHWTQGTHQYIQHLIDEQKSASLANLTVKTVDEGGKSPPSLTQYKKIEAKPGGTNPGAIYEGPDGKKYLIKGANHPSDDRAKNEVLASKLMKAVGVQAPNMHLVDLGKEYGGGLGVASEMVPTQGWKHSPAQIKAAQKEFAVHAWLANYDSVGTPAGDNLAFTSDGKVMNYDPGGALLYRAQGLPKNFSGGELPTEASEWNTMRDKGKNAAAHSIYGSMTHTDLMNSAEMLKNIDDDTISNLVAKYGPGTPAQKLKLAAILTKRKANILAYAGIDGSMVAKPVPGETAFNALAAKPAAVSSDPGDKNKFNSWSTPGDNVGAAGKAHFANAKAMIKDHLLNRGLGDGDSAINAFGAKGLHDALAQAQTVEDETAAMHAIKDWKPNSPELREAKKQLLKASEHVIVTTKMPEYGGSNYQEANAARHAAAEAKGDAPKFGPGNPPKGEDFWTGGKSADGKQDHGPLKHQEPGDSGHISEINNLTALHTSGDTAGLQKAFDYYNTQATTGKHSTVGGLAAWDGSTANWNGKLADVGKLNQGVKAAYAKALLDDLRSGNGIAADPSKPVTGGATWKAPTKEDWAKVVEAANKASTGSKVSQDAWTDFAHNMYQMGMPLDLGAWGAPGKASYEIGRKINSAIAAKEAALSGVAHDAPEHAKPAAVSVVSGFGPDKVPTADHFAKAGADYPDSWAKSAQTYKAWHDEAASGNAQSLDKLQKTVELYDGMKDTEAAHELMKGYVKNLVANLQSSEGSPSLPPPPEMPNYQPTTKTALEYYKGLTEKANQAYASGDAKALADAMVKKQKDGTWKPVWPVAADGKTPKTMNGKLLQQHTAKLMTQLTDHLQATTAASLAKPVETPIPSAGENKGNLPAMPDFDRAMLLTNNTNAGSHNAKVHVLKLLAQKGDIKGILALNYGTNTYAKKQVVLANDVLAALGSDQKVTVGQKKNAHPALTLTGNEQPVTHTPTGKPLSAALTDKELPAKIDFANYNGAGKGLSSKPFVNEANQEAFDKLIDLAKAGDIKGIKNATFQPIDPATGVPTGKPLPIGQHPSQHIKNTQLTLLQTMDEKLHPPEPLKFFAAKSFKDISEVSEKVPPAPFGTTHKQHPSSQTIGYFLALGQVNDPTNLAPAKTFNLHPEAKTKAAADYAKMNSDAKAFVSTMQASGGKKFADPKSPAGFSAEKWEKITVAAHKYATELPTGTQLYKWDNLTPDMKQKLSLAQPGLIIQNPAPVCTSYSPTSTKGFGSSHRFKIIVGQGAKVISSFGSGSYSGEGELSLLPNHRFMVLSHTKAGVGGNDYAETTVLLLPPDPAFEKKAKKLHF